VAGYSLIVVSGIQIFVNLMILIKDIWKDLKKSWQGSKLRLRLCGPEQAKKSSGNCEDLEHAFGL
jgi:hypothetical protein